MYRDACLLDVVSSDSRWTAAGSSAAGGK